MKKISVIMLILTLLCTIYSFSKQEKRVQKVVKTQKLNGQIRLDGILDESAWQKTGYTGFTQSRPNDGKAATEKTIVWITYDEKAVYVAARMYDKNPEKMITQLRRRDDFDEDSEWFVFYLDPYYDRRSGFQFAINLSGSICDWSISNDERRDMSWDGIWDYSVKRDNQGWALEMRIPFDQLRFKKKDGDYIWGVNFRRYIMHKNEVVTYSWKPVEEAGMVSHFARLEGIKGISPKRLVEFTPYTVGKAAYSPKEGDNPFKTGQDYSINAGMDMKIGLQSNLTLDLTVNPDFGQVEVDPAVINLSAAESFYQEKRPFFIEGSNIFNFGYGGTGMHIGANFSAPQFFYSRRIGRSPQGSVDSDGYTRYPEWSSILAAAKITGKIGNGNGWNIGILSSMTQREYAEVDLSGSRSKHEIEPFASYNVLRAQKEWNGGKQGLGFIGTSVFRNLRVPNMKDSLNNNAYSFAVDGWAALDENKDWVVTGWLGGTSVHGTKDRISDVQNSYPHYFQRPDAEHLNLSMDATSLNGWAGRFQLVKHQGNFIFNTAIGMISPGFNSNDLGYQSMADIINGHIMLGYRSFKVGKILRNWSTMLFTQRNYDFGGNLIGEQRMILIANATLLNYWSLNFQMSHNPERWDKYLTRGGPLAISPTYTWYDFGINSDRRKSLTAGIGGFHHNSASGSIINSIRLNLNWKPSSNLSISLNPSYNYSDEVAQWVTRISDDLMTPTYGQRYVFGRILQKTLALSLRINWIFTPKLSLQGYIQPFISVGAYSRFKELAQSESFDFNIYGENGSTITFADDTYSIDPDGIGPAAAFAFGNPDFNYKSLRGTIVFRWEYRPGSTLFFVWTQNRADYSDPGYLKFGRDIGNLFKAPGDNIFMLKFTYRFKL